ncbi:MAG: ACT domain-containing protein [Deltaproteobacteria bacterium]
MKLTQISVFLENKKGRLYDACSTLGKSSINIRALTVAESEDFGVLRMVVDRPDAAAKALKKDGFVASFTEIVAVEVGDRPGGLAGILKVLDKNGVNIEYMYGFVEKSSDMALMVFRFDDPDAAIKVLLKNKVRVVGKKEIGEI